MRLTPLIGKDLRRWWSDRQAMAVSLLLPLALTGILGISFGGLGGGSPISVIPLALVGDPPTYVRDALDRALDEIGLFDAVWMSRDYAEDQVTRGEMRAALIIPDDVLTRFLDGGRVEFTLWKDINSEFKAGIVEQILERMLLYLRAGEAAYVGAWPEDWMSAAVGESAIETLLESGSALDVYRQIRDGAATAGAAWDQVQTQLDHGIALREAFADPRVELAIVDRGGDEIEANADAQASVNMFEFFLPGMAVFFLMFSASAAGADLHREREAGTLRRMMATPVSVRELLVGKWAFGAMNGVLQLAVLFGLGRLVFGLDLGSDLLSLPIMALATSAALASVFLVLALLARSEKQAGQLGTGITLFMAIVGGNFMSPDAMPGFMRAIARFMPNYWANQGFNDIVLSDGDLAVLAGPLLVLGLVAAGFLGLAMLLMRLRERRGGLL